MVAVVSGSGLGLFNAGTANGNSNVGRGRDQVFVNTTTGNLVVQSVDDTLSALGLDFAAIRTYNSQGLTDEDNNDQWRLGVHQRIYNLTGTVNTAGSTITKVFGDGAEVKYTWNTTRSRYESTDGDGANDFLAWNATNSTWTWTDGSARATEEYGLVNSVQRIKFSRDTDGNTVTYNYTGSLLTSLNMAGATAQTVNFTYSGNNLTAIAVVSNGVTQTLTRYSYDGLNRLQTVTLDLTPGDNAVTDNVSYTTTYTYDGTSKRIASITQKDGSSVAFTYQQINGDYRLRTVTDAENRTATFTYNDVTTSGGTGGTPMSPPANTAVLSNQDTVNLPRNDAALTTNATQTTPYTRNDGALSTTDTQTTPYSLNTAALTTPPGGGPGSWGAQTSIDTLISSMGTYSSVLGVAFDSNGNGFALASIVDDIWYSARITLYRYTRSNNSWAVSEQLGSYSEFGATWPPDGFNGKLAVDAAGNAIVAWNHIVAPGVYVRRYDAATSTLGSQTTLSSTANVRVSSAAINGARAVVTVADETSNLAAHRLSSGTWTASGNLGIAYYGSPAGIDDQGNINIVFGRSVSGSGSADLVSVRYTASTNTWGAVELRESSSTTVQFSDFAFDAAGNGFAVWQQGNDIMFSRYTRSNNSWTTAAALDAINGVALSASLAMDSAGNALVGWVQSDGSANSAYVKRYNAATSAWGSVTPLESTSGHVYQMDVSINGNYAAATWQQLSGSEAISYAATFNGSTWTSPVNIESATNAGHSMIAVDSSGNASALWGVYGEFSPYAARFTAGSGGGSPYYPVPAGATWQSIANTLYAINSAAAGSALQAALGNPALTTGAQLTGFPAVLNVTTTITVPAYYTIPSGATWQSIANAVYGVNSAAAGSALQTALSNPPLTAGNRLTGFPATLSVTTTLAPHYLVPAGASWQSIANALYGSGANNSAGANALQTALGNPSIASGQRLYSIPATLGVTTTVPWFYTVQSGNTWSGITQSIYGTTDANAITALQAALGTSTLTVGARLTVPTTLNYTTGGTPGQSIYLRTDILDALGLTTTYLKDAAGRIISVQTPTVGGARLETRYTYDTVSGNVATIVEDPTGLNRVTTLTYDAVSGLLLSTRDSLGNTVSRTYNANNQLETETSYLVRDPDGAGSGQPSSPLVSRYFYDGENHLRYAISADGRVTEHVYDTPGQRTTTYRYAAIAYSGPYTLSALDSWATGQRANALERADYAYDFRGNVSTITQWAATNSSGAGTGAASTTRFIYDQRGMLLSTVEARGEATSTPTTDYVTNYTYDGLGRMLTTSSWVSSTETARLVQTNSYDDANRRTVSTFANGLTKTSTYNRSGELISAANGPAALGTASYNYDANGRLRVVTDQTGVKSYAFYDDAGRKIGSVDGDGSLMEFVYNRASQLIKTIRFSTALGSTTQTSLAGGSWSSVLFATLRSEANATPAANQIARHVYDASGALAYTIDEIGGVTQNIYDGAGRLTDQIRFFNTQTITSSVDEVLPSAITVAANTADRRTRYFYNGDGQLAGTLDGAGFLKENVYDAAGRLTTTIGYNNASDTGRWLTGTLDTLRPGSAGSTAQLDAARDITARFFYDAQGRRIGELDGEGYLTECVYDVAGNVLQKIRYATALTFTPGSSTFASLRTTASAGANHTTTYTYDGIGQVLTETNFENTQTSYTYDIAGNVVSVTRANGVGAEARTTATRYDALGRITQELSAEGSVTLAALGGSPTQAQIDDIWNKYGVTYTYDNSSRRTSMTVRPNDTTTLTTFFYYDSDGRLRFELDPRGQVTEHRYNALGQRTDSLVYWRTVSIASPAGGLLTPALITALTATESANVHEKTTYGYSLRGEVTGTTSVAGATTTASYNIFGELQSSNAGTGFTATDYTYDGRGLIKLTRRGGTTFEDRTYDAFGRLAILVDARGNTSTMTYDRLGRELTSQQPGDPAARQTTYDGFSRVLTVRDKLNNTTSYAYNDSTRTVTITTPEGIVVSTVHNRHGDTLTVTANGNTTTYAYDRNGALTGASDSLGSLEGRTYDRAGRQVTATDAAGTITTLVYDASNRLLTRTVDSASGGLQLVTTYAYDTQNRIFNVTEPGGRLTRTQYDRDGRVSSVIEDPNGTTPRRTDYAYDAANNTTLVTEGVGSANPRRTQYVYDALGRRTDEYLDPTSLGGTLNLRTQYRYDNNGNVTRKVDARGYSTWYVYDVQNRLTQTIDALGGVTQLTYDAEDRVAVTRRFFNTVSTAAFGDAPASQTISTTVNDQVTRTVYDRDGREKYKLDTISATGTNGATETAVVTERTLDNAGNVTRTRVYRNAITVPSTPSTSNVAAALTTAGNDTATLHADDHVAWTAYDLRGRPVFTVDGTGAVVKMEYDASGNVKGIIAYATSLALSNLMTTASLTTWSDQAAVANYPRNRITRFWYDSLNRERFAVDAEGYLAETRHLDSTNQQQKTAYAGKPTIAAGATLAQVVTAAAAAPNQTANQTSTQTFDVGGRITQATDANGRSEYFSYDAVGNKIRYVNKRAASSTDAAYTWTFEYDANGRLTYERSPSVTYSSVNPSTFAVTETTAQNVTRNEYDAMGNLIARTEAYGIAGQARVARFEYDSLGRQTASVTPTVGIYDTAGDSQLGNGSAVAVTETQTEVRSETAYDVFGNAFRERLVTTAAASNAANGIYAYKAYDNLGRVKYEVDAKNQATSYVYDVFGNKTQVTRHAAVLSGSPWTTATSVTLTDVSSRLTSNAANDRTITTTFDRLGRELSVRQPSAQHFIPNVGSAGGTSVTLQPTAEYTYNAFGDVVMARELTAPSTWATSYAYYDRRGLKTAGLDASRFLTQYFYEDETGDLTRQIEYARPTTGAVDVDTFGTIVTSAGGTAQGDDRETRFTYDKLNRKVSETKVNLEYSYLSSGALTTTFTGSQTTTYGYDAVGNQTLVRVTNPDDGSNVDRYTWYDALGRAIATAEPQRNVGNGQVVIPLTRLRNDANGNLVQKIEYYYGTGTIPVDGSVATAYSPNASVDRTTTMVVDARGNTVRMQDATGAIRSASYNLRGDVAKEWQVVVNPNILAATSDDITDTVVTLYRYDAVGQQNEIVESQRYNGASTLIATRIAEYNAFGEITSKYNQGAAEAEKSFFHYDQLGRVWRTNADDGVDKVYQYDLQGNATVELRSRNVDLGSSAYASAQAVVSGVAAASLMRTESVYDLRGNVIERRMPTFEISSGLSPVGTNLQLTTINGSAYINWIGTLSNTVTETFEYRPAGTTGTWTPVTIEQISAGVVGANIHSIYNASYEYRIRYSRGTEGSVFAESTGTFRLDRGTNTNFTSISVTPQDTSLDVAPIAIQQSGPINLAATFNGTTGWNGFAWQGQNSVLFNVGSLGAGPYRIYITYTQYSHANPSQTRVDTKSWDWNAPQVSASGVTWTEGNADYGGLLGSGISIQVYGGASFSQLIAQTNAPAGPPMLIWAAPADTSVTATFKYKTTAQSTYSSVQAQRFGTQFRIDVANLLTSTSDYDYEIEYVRSGEVVSRRGGQFNSSGVTTTRFPNGTISDAALNAWSQNIPTPLVGAGYNLQWSAPPSSFGTVTATFGIRTNGSSGAFSPRTINTGAPYSVYLGDLPQNQPYEYQIVYTLGGRTIAEQRGVVTMQFTPASTTTNVTGTALNSAPEVIQPVATVAGVNGVGPASGVPNGTQPTWISGQGGGYWMYNNEVDVSFATVAASMGAYVRIGISFTWTNGFNTSGGPSTYMTPVISNTSGVGSRHITFPAYYVSGQTNDQNGRRINTVTAVNVYLCDAAGNNLVTVRSTGATGTGGTAALQWAAPTQSGLTTQFYVNGTLRSTSTSGANLLGDVSGYTGTNNYEIRYFRSGDPQAIVSASGQFSSTGVTTTLVGGQSYVNRNPSWIPITANGNTVTWSRVADQGSYMQFEYSADAVNYTPLSIIPAGDNTNFSASVQGFNSGRYYYRLVYASASSGVLPYVRSAGYFDVVTNVVTNTTVLDRQNPHFNQQYGPARIQPVTLPANSDVVSWSYPKNSAGDSVRFFYTVGGTEYTVDLSGNAGPNFSAAMSALPIAANQSVTWRIEYRSSGLYPYAMANGSATITVTGTQQNPVVSVLSQELRYPSGVQQLAAPTDLGGDYLGWSSLSPGGATVRFYLNGVETALETAGPVRRINLAGLAAGSYSYELTYTNGASNPHARVRGSFTVTKSPGAITGQAFTIAPPRPESTFDTAPTISTMDLVWPPNSVYYEYPYGQGGPQYLYGPRPYDQLGGWVQEIPPSAELPNGQYRRNDPPTYKFFAGAQAITWPRVGGDENTASLVYWSTSTPNDVKTTSIGNYNGIWAAYPTDQNGFLINLANGTYGYRIEMRRSGAAIPWGIQEGTFVRSNGAYTSITPTPNSTPVVQTVMPTSRQTFDRWDNVLESRDTSNNVTNYRYNARSQLVQTLEATDKMYRYSTTSAATDVTGRAEKTNFYDSLGRLIETQDGYDQATRVSYNAAGQQLSKRNADFARYNATSTNVYDIFGSLLQTTDEVGYRTRYKYDKAGNIIETWREITSGAFTDASATSTAGAIANLQVKYYKYDEQGRRVSETNGVDAEVTRYHYDHRGNVIARISPLQASLGQSTRYTYDINGKMITETDGLGGIKSWTYNSFARMLNHTELTNVNAYVGSALGATITYNYDEAGLMTSETSNRGKNVQYGYDVAGNLTSINDITVNRQTLYRYDAAGRRSRESVFIDGRMHQDVKISYDGHNRVSGLDDPDYREVVWYDANGNRSYVGVSYIDHQNRVVSDTLSYTYDEMNRVLTSTHYTLSAQMNRITRFTYNGRGDRLRAISPETGMWERRTLGGTVTHNVKDNLLWVPVTEDYTYDGLGRLKTVTRDVEHVSWTSNWNLISRSYVPTQIRSYEYDKANRVYTDTSTSFEGGATAINRVTTHFYDLEGRASESTTRRGANIESVTRFGRSTWNGSTWSRGYDDAGNARGYEVANHNPNNGNLQFTTTYKSSYQLGENYLETQQSVNRSDNPSQTNYFYRNYNANGELSTTTDSSDASRNRYYANNQNGQALTVVNGNFAGASLTNAWDAAIVRGNYGNFGHNYAKGQYYFFANGNMIGTFGQLQKNGTFEANFDVNYTPISSAYPSAVPSTVVAQTGDTLRSIAAKVFGDATLWYIIAEENGLTNPDEDLPDGMQLRIPNQVVSLSNTSDSFKPFNPADAIGDTTPTLPDPPAPKGGCGVIGMIIMIVVMVVVSIVTAGAAAVLMASMAGQTLALGTAITAAATGTLGAALATAGVVGSTMIGGMVLGAAVIGGAVGSAVSQGVGIAIGAQEKFSWKQVAVSALTAAVTFGVGKGMDSLGVSTRGIGMVTRAVANNAASQGVNMAMGLQKKFDWRGVVTAAIAAPMANFIGDKFSGAAFSSNGPGSIGHMLSHAALGAGVAAIRGEDVAAGAIGGATEAFLSGALPLTKPNVLGDALRNGFSQLAAAAIAKAAGRDGSVAAGAARNAFENNYLKHAEAMRLAVLQEQLTKNPNNVAAIKHEIAALELVSRDRDQALRDALLARDMETFTRLSNELSAAANEYIKAGNPYSPIRPEWNASRFDTFDAAARSTLSHASIYNHLAKNGIEGRTDLQLRADVDVADATYGQSTEGAGLWHALTYRRPDWEQHKEVLNAYRHREIMAADTLAAMSSSLPASALGGAGMAFGASPETIYNLTQLGLVLDGVGGSLGAAKLQAQPIAGHIFPQESSLSLDSTRATVRGTWTNVNESMSQRARDYQTEQTGRTGEAFVVDDVKFDGHTADRSGYLDAKGPGYANFVDAEGKFYDWWDGKASLLNQAQRQIAVAGGAPIKWHIAEADAVAPISNLLRQNEHFSIDVLHVPPRGPRPPLLPNPPAVPPTVNPTKRK